MFNRKQKEIDRLNERCIELARQLRDSKLENDKHQKEYEILLENASETRARITDLENNIELLMNSLTEENVKELSNKLGNDR